MLPAVSSDNAKTTIPATSRYYCIQRADDAVSCTLNDERFPGNVPDINTDK